VVDVGKFFWHSAIEWFPKYKVPTIDAIVLTHAHADAMGGLDDLRDWTNNQQAAIPIYTRQSDLEVLSRTHFYLVDQAQQTGGGGVAKLIFETIAEQPFDVEGLTFVPLPVPHGERMNVFGYRIGGFSYVSDASDLPMGTADLIRGSDVLVLDALRERPHRSHLSLEQAIDFARELRAHKTYFVDMTHDVDHDAMNEKLVKLRASDGIDVSLAYDGMRIEVDLGEQG
jgi:phosphoribosyl 1,2-cyclic phosphodiesterase